MTLPDYEVLAGAGSTNSAEQDLGINTGLLVDDASHTPTWVRVRPIIAD